MRRWRVEALVVVFRFVFRPSFGVLIACDYRANSEAFEMWKCKTSGPCDLNSARCVALLAALAGSSMAFGRQVVDTNDDLAAFGPKGGDPDEEFGARQRKPPEEPAAPAAAGGEAPAPSEASRFHFRFGADYTTEYYFRGLRQEDRGFIIQPYGELSFDLHKGESSSLTLLAGLWNSFHDRATGADDTGDSDFTDKWYEADLYVGVGATLGQFGFSAIYVAYTSPSDAYDTIDEVVLGVSYDDAPHWVPEGGEKSEGIRGLRIAPSLSLGIEVGDDYADGADTKRGIYLQPGIAPGFKADLPLLKTVDFSFPIAVGLSLDNYYEDASGKDNAYGYVSVGAKASIPLPLPESYGAWTLTGGVQALFLGDTPKEFNDNDGTEVLGSIGISVAF